MTTKKVTITDLANITGISRSTISRVLNNNDKVHPDVRQKVDQAIEESGYQRKSTKVKYEVPIRSVTIATLVHVDTPDHYYSNMISKFRDKFRQMGLDAHLVMLTPEMSDSQVLNKFSDSECVLILGPELPIIANALKSRGTPVVLVNGFDSDMKISSVSLDYSLGGEMVANYLLHKGHRNIAMLTAQTRPSISQRTYGFEQKAKELGADKVTVVDILDICNKLGDATLAQSIRQGKAGADFGASKILAYILDNKLFNGASAVFCLCDRTAISLIDELEKRQHQVPRDLSVVGFDNSSIGTMITPSLTSVGCDYNTIAQTAIQLIIQEFNTPSTTAKRINIGVELFERKSVIAFEDSKEFATV
ncbi:LacI family transcriptional regulator [Photobacterium sp. ZSDE20]|uniref:LacI family transcriptional regulator n=1 Tax=Photobacterium pectinilyticum TaxID=2906793 RepID=A0ABT1MVE1_9GAMM|nr:LacI family DNA-binding transcriptional regulator [Photobacterium sp. ZSDE20]MCQ1056483.1 LacI family transcriptional regulator [Photobacterium sp. ZSDE20]MDD1820618.1 LacI family transcriptional regulator [Photobacterium sp. ZSDE20]